MEDLHTRYRDCLLRNPKLALKEISHIDTITFISPCTQYFLSLGARLSLSWVHTMSRGQHNSLLLATTEHKSTSLKTRHQRIRAKCFTPSDECVIYVSRLNFAYDDDRLFGPPTQSVTLPINILHRVGTSSCQDKK